MLGRGGGKSGGVAWGVLSPKVGKTWGRGGQRGVAGAGSSDVEGGRGRVVEHLRVTSSCVPPSEMLPLGSSRVPGVQWGLLGPCRLLSLALIAGLRCPRVLLQCWQ